MALGEKPRQLRLGHEPAPCGQDRGPVGAGTTGTTGTRFLSDRVDDNSQPVKSRSGKDRMTGEAIGLVIAAIVTTGGAVLIAIINRRTLGRIEDKQDAMHAHSREVADQVRTRNGRTLAQTVEDQSDELAQLRGDTMELAIQFARHTSDPHTHDIVRRYRQSQRDRMELGKNARELEEHQRARESGRRAHGRGPDLHEGLDEEWDQ